MPSSEVQRFQNKNKKGKTAELYMSNNGYFTTEHCFKRDTQIDLKIN